MDERATQTYREVMLADPVATPLRMPRPALISCSGRCGADPG